MDALPSHTTALRLPARFCFTPAQTRLIRLTVARECSNEEFDHFIAVAERVGLDPLRRQINALVLNASALNKRQMVPQVGIDGLRAIAARHGDYRPMETEPEIEFDTDRCDECFNPLGIVRAKVVVWKRFDGAWFPIAGEAWWDEYAPRQKSEADWALSEESAANRPSKRRAEVLSSNWRRMGRVLICKCAEAQALRRGWPEDLSGIYGEEELHRALSDEPLASARVDVQEQTARNIRLAGGSALMFEFAKGAPLQCVERAEVGRRLQAFARRVKSKDALDRFHQANVESLRIFWEWDSSAALAFKQAIARARLRLEKGAGNEQTSTKTAD